MKILAAICLLAVGVSAQVGYSGIVSPDGVNTQFSQDFARQIVLIGPSGIVTSTGENRQLTAPEAALHVATQAAPALPVSQYLYRGLVGPSGIVRPSGRNVQFDGDEVLVGPSGIVRKDGQNVQFTDEHHFRSKRALVGPSGAILPDGTPIQFSVPGTYILLDGPSGIVFSDGYLYQKRN